MPLTVQAVGVDKSAGQVARAQARHPGGPAFHCVDAYDMSALTRAVGSHYTKVFVDVSGNRRYSRRRVPAVGSGASRAPRPLCHAPSKHTPIVHFMPCTPVPRRELWTIRCGVVGIIECVSTPHSPDARPAVLLMSPVHSAFT
jgi:hypothetical protein